MNMMASIPPPPALAKPDFVDEGGRFLGIALRGGLLQIVTLGFYRFWMLTDLRRHLWSTTKVEGDALEYTGRARELLIGFLIAMAVLAPAFLAYFLLGVWAESWKAFASVPLYGFLYLFGQYAAYRARRYRLSHTVWRGVRFWMEKGAVKYALISAGMMLLSMLTGGLLLPLRSAMLERYKFARTRYGDVPARFTGTALQLFKSGILFWLIGVATVVGVFAVGYVVAGPIEADGNYPVPPWFMALVPAAAIVLALCYALYLATEWRWFLNGVRIGEARVESRFPRGQILGLFLVYGFCAMAIVIAFAIVGGGVAAVYIGLRGTTDLEFNINNPYASLWPIGVAGLVYLLLLTVLGAFYRYTLQHNLWRAAVRTMTIQGLDTLSHARAAGEAAGALGEGMLEGLDMGGF